MTTVQSGGDDNASILKLKQMVDSGQIKGPRIVSSARVMVGQMKSEQEVRAAIDAARASGADSIAEVAYPAVASMTVDTQYPFHPTDQETRNLRAAATKPKTELHFKSMPSALMPRSQPSAWARGDSYIPPTTLS